jgi:hypothetical protein
MSIKINRVFPKHQPSTVNQKPQTTPKVADKTKQTNQAVNRLAVRFGGDDETKPAKKTVGDFYQKILQAQPLNEADKAKKIKIPINLSKNASLEDYRSATDKAILQKAGYSMLDKDEIETARGLIGLKDNFNLKNLKDLDKANKLVVTTNQYFVEKAKVAGQAVLQFKDYEAKLKDSNNAESENETNRMGKDIGGLHYETFRKIGDGIVNIVPDTINALFGGKTGELNRSTPNFGRAKIGEMYDELAKTDAEVKIPRIDTGGVMPPYKFESRMMRRNLNGIVDGEGPKAGDTISTGASIVAPLILGKITTPTKVNTLKSLGALPEVERTVLIPKTAQEIVEKRYDEISNKGHTVQRHGAEVTEKQLDARAIEGKDPITGTTKDAFRKDAKGNPLPHLTNKNATKFTSKEALVKAEKYVKNTQEYKNALANIGNDKVFAIEDVKLQDVFGSDYKKQVFGKTRVGSRNNPTGATLTDFTDGTIRAVFKKDSNGAWHIFTMFAEPKK